MSNDNDDELVITNSDFLILVSPTFKEDEWTGHVNIDVAYPKNHGLTKETYRGIDFFVRMMIASLTVMEENESVREAMYNCVSDEYSTEFEDLIEADNKNKRDVKIEYGDGNVINLTFNSDTEGSA